MARVPDSDKEREDLARLRIESIAGEGLLELVREALGPVGSGQGYGFRAWPKNGCTSWEALCQKLRRPCGQPGCCNGGMANIGMTVSKRAESLDNTLVNIPLGDNSTDGLITATQTLGQRDDIRRYPFLFKGKIAAGSPATGHHLIHDQQHLVAVTDIADNLKVTFNSRYGAQCRANDGLDNES